MQPHDFQYILVIDRVEYELQNAPDGWDESKLNWQRDGVYFGLVRTFTQTLKFVTDGAYLLRKEFYTNGVLGAATLIINKLNRSTWQYELFYEGEIDFSEPKDGDSEFTCNVMEGGLSKLLKAYENVKYSVPILGSGMVKMQLPGLRLKETGTLIFIPVSSGDPKADAFTELQVISNEAKSTVFSMQDVPFEQNSSPNFATSDKWFFQATADTDIEITGNVQGNFVYGTFGPGSKTFNINIYNSAGTVLQTIYTITRSAVEIVPFDVNFSLNTSVTAGEKLFIYLEIVGSTIPNSGFVITSGEINASYETISADSFCYGLRPKYLFEQLMAKMGGAAYPIQSYLLDQWDQLIFTSGDAIRQIPNAKIKISPKEFFTSVNAVLNVGLGLVGGFLALEEKNYFMLKGLQMVDIGEVKDLEVSPAKEYLNSSIKVGYPDEDYDEINGRSEVNSTQVYSTPISRVQGELDLLSIARTDIYGIEFLRINLNQKDTTDNKADNDSFMIKIKDTPETVSGDTYYRPEGVEAYLSVQGITAGDTAYNLDLSPKKNLLRHGDFLHGMVALQDGLFINFESAEKNADLVTVDLNGVRVAESDNVNISSLPAPLFLPFKYEFTTKLERSIYKILNVLSNGYVIFTWRGNRYRGFFMDASSDVARNSEQEWTLLAHPDDNLLTLVH